MSADYKITVRAIGVWTILAGILTTGGCFSTDQPLEGEVVKSAKQRETSPVVSADDQTELIAGNTDFAFNFYQLTREEEDGNVLFCPYSISLSLAMTYAGAREETERQMAEALRFTLPQERLHNAFNALDLALSSRDTSDSGGVQLKFANGLWGQKDEDFQAEFLDVLAVNYDAGMHVLNFVQAPDECRKTINDWVAARTADKIQDLIPQGYITSDTRFVLTNAVYFNALWSRQFEESATNDRPFYLLDGSEISVPTMHQTSEFGYAVGDGVQAVELPYKGDELSMVIFLPDEGRFEEFEQSLDRTVVNEILDTLSKVVADVILSLPKFQFEWQGALNPVLSDLGMPIAFNPSADFTGIIDPADPKNRCSLKAVLHKTFIDVTEKGTEAAAATAVIGGPTIVSEPQYIELCIDRPFVFIIRDVPTGAILFVGRVLDPSQH